VKYKFSKFVPTAVTQQQVMHANNEENVAMVDALVLRQEDQPRSHHSICPLAVASIQIYFFGEGERNLIWRQLDRDSLTFHAVHIPMYIDLHKQLVLYSKQITAHVCISFI